MSRPPRLLVLAIAAVTVYAYGEAGPWVALWAAVAAFLTPPAVLGPVAWAQNRRKARRRARGLQVAYGRRGTWYWRIWWWYGYNLGLYRLDWDLKRRVKRKAGTLGRCIAGAWSEDGDGVWVGERCCLDELHRGEHRLVPDDRGPDQRRA